MDRGKNGNPKFINASNWNPATENKKIEIKNWVDGLNYRLETSE